MFVRLIMYFDSNIWHGTSLLSTYNFIREIFRLIRRRRLFNTFLDFSNELTKKQNSYLCNDRSLYLAYLVFHLFI